eukprot:TRINITY_DN2384_c0_g1_i2.p1 TRINITY_DN2384_c0_g1~~TRINITY_DN2384_c0_g1_i2.p1  ORF type:complete len:204 (-),score=29.62 TRINITY_DN2384_c0_g1_i2:364-975(-)
MEIQSSSSYLAFVTSKSIFFRARFALIFVSLFATCYMARTSIPMTGLFRESLEYVRVLKGWPLRCPSHITVRKGWKTTSDVWEYLTWTGCQPAMTADDVCNWNTDLVDCNHLKVGQIIRVPGHVDEEDGMMSGSWEESEQEMDQTKQEIQEFMEVVAGIKKSSGSETKSARQAKIDMATGFSILRGMKHSGRLLKSFGFSHEG